MKVHGNVRRRIEEQRGSALLIVLVVLVGLTVLGAAGLALTDDDIRHSENVEASTATFYAADAGLQRFMGESNDGTAAASYTIGSVPVTVTPTLMATLAGGESMYRIRSVATRTEASGATTSRAVSALAIYKTGSAAVTATAAIASGTGLHKNGSSGTISGHDHASPFDPKCSGTAGPSVAGVAVPPGGYSQNGKKQVPEGDPDIEEGGSGEELLEATNVDWENLSDGGGGMADYTIPPDSWPDFDALPADEWPVIFVEGNLSLGPNDDGRGTIIATGNVTMSGSFEWDGLMLVGGYLTSNGNQTVEGAMITGLNILLGESVPTTDIGNGNKSFLYNSCYVNSAVTGLSAGAGGGLALVPGSWHEEI